MPYLTCENVTVGYDGQPVTENINFALEKGNYLCIVGENGAGKSTLMKTLLKLIPPVAGNIVLENDPNKSHTIGYLPQQTVVQRDFPAAVGEIVLSGNLNSMKHKFFYGAEEKKRAEDTMKRLGIWELRKQSYRNLSGGQQQRVLLARALCATSETILLDEPVSGLDPKATADFYELIRSLNGEGVTIIMVTHDIQVVRTDASHILHVGQKSMLFFGTREEYLNSREFMELEGNAG